MRKRTSLTWFEPGAHNVQCDRTGFKVKSTEVKKQWDNLIVRGASYEERQPQDFVKGVADHPAVRDARPLKEKEVSTNEVKASDL